MPVTNSHLTFDINALILCDDSHFLRSLQRVFAKLGVRSERSADYAAALSALQHRKVDIVGGGLGGNRKPRRILGNHARIEDE